MRHSPIVPLVVLALALQGFCYLYSGWFFSALIVSVGQPMLTAFTDTFYVWLKAALLFVGAVAYARNDAVRPPIQVIGIVAGIYGTVVWFRSNHFGSWNVLHGDLLAIGKWSTVLFIVIGVLTLADLLLTRYQRVYRLRAFRS